MITVLLLSMFVVPAVYFLMKSAGLTLKGIAAKQ